MHTETIKLVVFNDYHLSFFLQTKTNMIKVSDSLFFSYIHTDNTIMYAVIQTTQGTLPHLVDALEQHSKEWSKKQIIKQLLY